MEQGLSSFILFIIPLTILGLMFAVYTNIKFIKNFETKTEKLKNPNLSETELRELAPESIENDHDRVLVWTISLHKSVTMAILNEFMEKYKTDLKTVERIERAIDFEKMEEEINKIRE